MNRLNRDIAHFLYSQGYVVISTVDKDGFPHSACKGIVEIDQDKNLIYLLDVYRARTHENLMHNPNLSITAVDEHAFTGFCLKGKARMLPEGSLGPDILKAWEERITTRLTRRLLKNIQGGKGGKHHPEALLPNPKYLICVEIKEIVDLTPRNMRIDRI